MYNLYAGDCSFNKDYTNGTAVRHVRHANIVQRVKIRYKIKIDYRVQVCCFYGVLLYKYPLFPRLSIIIIFGLN